MIKRILTIAMVCCFPTIVLAYQDDGDLAPSDVNNTTTPFVKNMPERDKDNVPISLPPNPFYLGIFGGGGNSSDNNFTQQGIVFFDSSAGGPLIIKAQNAANTNSVGIGGAHIGYNWLGQQMWGVVPATEIEAYYLGVTESAGLYNPSTRIPEHFFIDSFPINSGVFLANIVLSSQMNRFHPYLSGGIGASILSISNAVSTQVSPAEPGVNHFNSNPNASNWTFAAQGKAGLLFNVDDHWSIFAEYRYLFLAPTQYLFGSTQYPTHVATTNWTVNFASLNVNMGSAGIAYNF